MPAALRPIDAVTMVTMDGQERRFLLSMGGIRRVKTQLGVSKMSDLLEKDIVDAGIPLLWEALLDKNGLTLDAFADILPANVQDVVKVVLQLIGVSFPEANPTTAVPNPEQQSVN